MVPSVTTACDNPGMRLETHEGLFADPATPEDISRGVAGLHAIGEAFIILNDDGVETYLQAAGTVGENFLVEYRDGRAGDHYRADRRATAAELRAVLVLYLERDPRWREVTAWHRVRVDKPSPSA